MPPFILMVMFMYTESDFQSMISAWAKDSSNISYLKSQGAFYLYTPEEMQSIAENLKNDIINGFLSVVREPGARFRGESSVSVDIISDHEVSISFPSEALRRESMIAIGGSEGVWQGINGKRNRAGEGRTGKGVYDIIGLFSNGYSTGNQVIGEWYASNGTDYRMRSLTSRSGSAFVPDIVASYESRYKGLTITYPKNWG